MKRLIAILTLTTTLLCTACGNSDTGTSGSSVSSTVDNNSVSQAENDESSENNNSSAADIEDSEQKDEGHYGEWHGLNMFVPPNFDYKNRHGHRIWEKKLETGSFEYLSVEAVPDYGSNHGIDTYQLENVPEIVHEYIVSAIDECYELDPSSEFTVETNEEKEVLGVTFIRQTGIVNVKLYGSPAGELYYTAYYGLLDLKYNEKAPLCWITFSDDESTKSELESIADILAEKIERVEE